MEKYAFLAMLVSSPAFADGPATVTLTQDELQAIIRAETTKALAQNAVNQEAEKAKAAYAKINSAFAPAKPEPTPVPTPSK